MSKRVAYPYAGQTQRRFIEAVYRATIGKAAERVASGLCLLLCSYSKVDDSFTLGQLTNLAYPGKLDGIENAGGTTVYRNATKQTQRGLKALRDKGLITYEPAVGPNSCAWVSIEQHAPLGVERDPPYKPAKGDALGPLGGHSTGVNGDIARPPSEKSQKITKDSQVTNYQMWVDTDTIDANQERNLKGIQEARKNLPVNKSQ